jgi:hypothetical protein
MLKKITSRLLGFAPIVLVLALAFCSDDSKPDPELPTVSSSSSAGTNNGGEVLDSAAIKNVNISLNAPKTELTIKGLVEKTGLEADVKLDLVKVYLVKANNEQVPIVNNQPVRQSYDIDERVDVSSKDYCGNITVKIEAYLKRGSAPRNLGAYENKTLIKDGGVCSPSSSSRAASSASVSYGFSYVGDLEINSLTGDRGIIFPGTLTPNTSQAHIYMERAGQGVILKTDNSRIVSLFVKDGYPGSITGTSLPEPQSTSQFILCPQGSTCYGDFDIEFEWAYNNYLMVCPPGSDITIWSNSCYLIKPSTRGTSCPSSAGTNCKEKIMVWSVN